MLNIIPPYHSLQEMNLDWILTKIKMLLRFIPDDGTVGQILRRTQYGAEWSNEQGGGGGAVNSVNGQTGDVVLDKNDIGLGNVDNVQQYSAINPPPYPVTKVNGQTGVVTINKTSVGLGNVANVLQYSASNPPPYPVTSVNSQTGAVTISVPTKTSDLNNDSGFVNAAGAAAAAPVQSVNGATGAVTFPLMFVDAASGIQHTINTYNAEWTADDNYYWFASMGGANGVPATLSIDGVTVAAGGIPANTYALPRPNTATGFIKKGQVFRTRDASNTTYVVYFYKLQS